MVFIRAKFVWMIFTDFIFNWIGYLFKLRITITDESCLVNLSLFKRILVRKFHKSDGRNFVCLHFRTVNCDFLFRFIFLNFDDLKHEEREQKNLVFCLVPCKIFSWKLNAAIWIILTAQKDFKNQKRTFILILILILIRKGQSCISVSGAALKERPLSKLIDFVVMLRKKLSFRMHSSVDRDFDVSVAVF